MTESKDRPRVVKRLGASAVLAAALVGGGLVAGPSMPAHAAPEPKREWTFDSPSGADWTVPAGVSKVWVGIRGGSGGRGTGTAGCRTSIQGDQFSVLLDVRQGDVITTYAGMPATGKSDWRDGGKGFINGGDGGKRSATAGNGGGGGGAAAVKLNGELMAVAAGGGGCGGDSGEIPNLNGQFWNRAGGDGGLGAGYLGRTAGTNGEGKKGGAGGVGGQDNAGYARYKLPGSNGSTASFGSSGGGGGGGGGGWPASGSGGGAGHGFAGFGGGGGGGAGLSMVKPGLNFQRFTPEEDAHVPPPIPDADGFRPKITVPLASATRISGSGTATTGEGFTLRVLTGLDSDVSAGLDGTIQVYVDNVLVSPKNDPYGTGGDRTVPIPGLAAGTHTVRAEFSPTTTQHYWNRDAGSRAEMQVVVTDPAPPIPDDPEKIDTVTTLTVPQGSVYGAPGDVVASVKQEGTANLPIGPGDLTITLDGREVDRVRVSDTNSSYERTFTLPADLAAGEHIVSAEFAGSEVADGSRAKAQTFTVAPATSTIELEAPARGTAGAPISATATVSTPAPGLTGEVELLAGGTPISGATVAPDGSVTFPAALVPVGTKQLTARYLGDGIGNILGSTSEISPYTVMDSETETTLHLSSSSVTYDQPVTFTATVRNLSDQSDPKGEIEILFDGEVVETIPAGLDVDSVEGNAKAVFEMKTAGLTLGRHDVNARFVPAPGFGESATATPQTLTVRGIESELQATATPGTTAKPATVSVNARTAGSDTPPTGYVQAFVSSDVTLTSPAGGSNAAAANAAARNSGATAKQTAPGGLQPVGDPVGLDGGKATAVLRGLPAGTHEVTLRFTPDTQGQLPASDTVTVKVTAAGGGTSGGSHGNGTGGNSAGGGSQGGGSAGGSASAGGSHSGRLSTTGSDALLPLGIVGGLLVLGGGTAALIAARRRRTPTA